MQYKGSKILAVLTLSLFLSSTANATLMSRLGGDAYYDNVSDLTWITNANLALTNQFGLTLSTNANDDTANTVGSTGKMTWDNAQAWINGMNTANYLGFNDWRLPSISPINGTAINGTEAKDGSTDKGTNISRPGTLYGGSLASEMAYLFYNTLGNVSDYNTGGTFDDGCSGSCLTNSGPFDNLVASFYWAGLDNNDYRWSFHNYSAFQQISAPTNNSFTIAVRSGDVSAVPVPAAVWLMGSALVGLFGFGRRKNS